MQQGISYILNMYGPATVVGIVSIPKYLAVNKNSKCCGLVTQSITAIQL